jgi:hypothetical protein
LRQLSEISDPEPSIKLSPEKKHSADNNTPREEGMHTPPNTGTAKPKKKNRLFRGLFK